MIIFHLLADLTVTIPEEITTDEGMAWFLGFGAMALVRIFRAGLKWFRRVGTERHD